MSLSEEIESLRGSLSMSFIEELAILIKELIYIVLLAVVLPGTIQHHIQLKAR
jgi:hypothetical protein